MGTALLERRRALDYLALTKPRVVLLVVLTTLVGYYVGANWEVLSSTLKRVDHIIAAILVLALVALGIRFVVRRRRERL